MSQHPYIKQMSSAFQALVNASSEGDMIRVLESQRAVLLSDAMLNRMRETVGEARKTGDPALLERIEGRVRLLQDARQLGTVEAARRYIRNQEWMAAAKRRAFEVLKALTTAGSLSEMWRVLQDEREVLVSEVADSLLRTRIESALSAGLRDEASWLESCHRLLKNAKAHGEEVAWRQFQIDLLREAGPSVEAMAQRLKLGMWPE